ncbi:hypothetical protein ACP70R_026423 [Stipagrostis hirtigluma subsp. patula]
MRSFMIQPVIATTLLLLVIAIVAPGLAVGTSPAINATCAAIDTPTYHEYDYCVRVLSADPAAAAATDARGVATAAVNITLQKAASTLSVISYLVDELSTCRGYYSGMVKSLAGVLVDFGAGRFDRAALAKAEFASDTPDNCDILLFQGSAKKNPIAQENTDNQELANIAREITDHVVNAS